MHQTTAALHRTSLLQAGSLAPMRIYAIDDHPMYTCGLASVLSAEPGCHWLGAAHSLPDAIRQLPTLQPDVILLDLALGGTDDLRTMAALRAVAPHARCVLIGNESDLQGLRLAAASDADGVVLRSATPSELLEVVHAARRGQRRVSTAAQQALAAAAQRHVPGNDLTPRERDLLGLMAHGLGNREIASRLGIALPTVKFHVTNIMSKLGADNRTAAVIAALRYRIVSVG